METYTRETSLGKGCKRGKHFLITWILSPVQREQQKLRCQFCRESKVRDDFASCLLLSFVVLVAVFVFVFCSCFCFCFVFVTVCPCPVVAVSVLFCFCVCFFPPVVTACLSVRCCLFVVTLSLSLSLCS